MLHISTEKVALEDGLYQAVINLQMIKITKTISKPGDDLEIKMVNSMPFINRPCTVLVKGGDVYYLDMPEVPGQLAVYKKLT